MVIPLRNLLAALAAIVMITFASAQGAWADRQCEAASFVHRAGDAYDRAASSGSAAAFASAAARFSDIRSLRLTRQFIGDMLKDHGSGFRGGDLQITECTSSGGNVVVTARTTGGTKVIFRLARAGGSYTVRDLNMKGVWLAQQMRSTFVGTISRTGSIDGLFKYLGG
jgi:hypothetical protein